MDRDVNGAKNIFLRNYEALGIFLVSSIGAYPLLRGDPSDARKICSCLATTVTFFARF